MTRIAVSSPCSLTWLWKSRENEFEAVRDEFKEKKGVKYDRDLVRG